VITITGQRQSGVLKRRRSSPVPAWVLIASRTLTSAILASAMVAVIVAIGRLLFGVQLPSPTLPAFVLGVIVGAAAFCCLSFAAASFIRNEDSAQPIVQAIILPLYFISGVLLPKDQLSSTLREIASVFPVSHAPKVQPDRDESRQWPALVPNLPDEARQAIDARWLDATQGRKIGSDPYDDPTQGRQIGSDSYDDATQGRKLGADPYDDPTQGQKIGSDPYDDPTRGR
jgi:hypothetical protein